MTKPKMFYFGCHGNPGHYLFDDQLSSVRNADEALPFATRILDTGLLNAKHSPIGQIQYSIINGWTIISMADCTGDSRPGSVSCFVAEGFHQVPDMILMAQERFPSLWKRINPQAGPELLLLVEHKYCEAQLEALRQTIVKQNNQIVQLLNHCDKEGGECSECSKIICPHHCPDHFHHDGCPACTVNSLQVRQFETTKPTPECLAIGERIINMGNIATPPPPNSTQEPPGKNLGGSAQPGGAQ